MGAYLWNITELRNQLQPTYLVVSAVTKTMGLTGVACTPKGESLSRAQVQPVPGRGTTGRVLRQPHPDSTCISIATCYTGVVHAPPGAYPSVRVCAIILHIEGCTKCTRVCTTRGRGQGA